MEKNVVVTDMNQNQIGVTYPKRAKGLVKRGRAEFVGDCEIRLLQTSAATVISNLNITEEQPMLKQIQFCARDFKFDPDCRSNAGQRVMVSTDDTVTELFEIGDWTWNWTQIIRDVETEPQSDYIFRFAMTGGHNDSKDEICQVMVFPEGEWEERYVYPLEKSRFRPVLSKRLDESKAGCDTFLRVYELPFSTGEHTRFRIMLVAQHCVARFFPAKEFSAYADMEDQTWAEWYDARMARLHSGKHMDFGNRYGLDTWDMGENFEDMREELEDMRDALQDAAQTLREEMLDAQSLWNDWEGMKNAIGMDTQESAPENCAVDAATREISN